MVWSSGSSLSGSPPWCTCTVGSQSGLHCTQRSEEQKRNRGEMDKYMDGINDGELRVKHLCILSD